MLRQKKVGKEKASRRPGRCAVPCAARFARGARKLASLKHARPFSRAPLRCSARSDGKVGTGSDSPSRSRFGPRGSPHPTSAVMRWRVAQGRADQGCACPKAAQRTSLRRPRPDRATQRARSEAEGQRIRLAFLLGTFLWRSKEKCLGRRAETRHATGAHQPTGANPGRSLKFPHLISRHTKKAPT